MLFSGKSAVHRGVQDPATASQGFIGCKNGDRRILLRYHNLLRILLDG